MTLAGDGIRIDGPQKIDNDNRRSRLMRISLDTDVLFWLTSKDEERLMNALHDYLDNMYFAN